MGSKILLVNASPLDKMSRAYLQARDAASNVQAKLVGAVLRERHLASSVLSPISGSHANAVINRPEDPTEVFRDSEALITELEGADHLIIATPMHNFTIPASLKLWIDYVVRTGRSFTYQDGRKVGLLRDRPALVVVSSGGMVAGDEATQADFLTPYLVYVLATIGIHDVRFLYMQGLARPHYSARDQEAVVRDLASDPVFGPLKLAS
jgi:FMN-dependent NADH-azoreductase